MFTKHTKKDIFLWKVGWDLIKEKKFLRTGEFFGDGPAFDNLEKHQHNSRIMENSPFSFVLFIFSISFFSLFYFLLHYFSPRKTENKTKAAKMLKKKTINVKGWQMVVLQRTYIKEIFLS